MTNFTILIDDADREENPTRPWTATLSLGAWSTAHHLVEAQERGKSPAQALLNLMAKSELLDSEPEDCPDCGVVKHTEAWRTWHDPNGNCHSHRRPN